VVDNAANGSAIQLAGVHPSSRAVRGVDVYPSLAELPFTPEVAFVLVGHTRIEAVIGEALAAGVRSFIVPGLGNEAGAAGPEVARRVAAVAQDAGAAMVGPNCMGTAIPGEASFWIGTIPPTFLPGNVSAVVQSGSIGEALIAIGPRAGFRCVVSSGGEHVTDVADYCEFFAGDEGTGAVALFLENVRRPDAFARSLGMLADAEKPVVCLKVGRSAGGARAVLAHSGAVVGSDVAFGAVLRAYGVIQVDDYAEMVETLELLARRRRPKGVRLGGITNSGGEGALLADQAEAAGLPFIALSAPLVARLREAFPNYVEPQNPVDAWAIDDVEKVFPGTLRLLAESGEFDVLVAQVDESQYLGAPEAENAALILNSLADAVEGTAILPAITSVQTNDPPAEVVRIAAARDVALLRGARAGMRALSAVARWKPRRPPSRESKAVDALPQGAYPEFESAEVLERYGIPVAARARAQSPGEAAAAAKQLGFPVVVKRDGPAHKSRDGGVVIGLEDEEAVRRAAERLGGPVLVAAQVRQGAEIFVGMHRDSDHGPVLVVGAGGSAAEALQGKSACLAPVDLAQAREMIEESAASALVPEARIEGLAAILVALGALALDHAEVSAVDVNPVIVGGDGVVAVDALVVVGGIQGGAS
jgi:acetyltransferase